MAFESLSDKLQNAFSKLKGKGVITESDINAAMREVKLALLEADVNFKVVKEFVAIVKEKCLGAEVLQSLTPAQQIIKIVNSELIDLMGGSGSKLTYSPSGFTVLMMVGLQGTGKTTTCGKLASFLSDIEAVVFKDKEDAERKGFDVLIIDTAGRLQIDENLMEELASMKSAVRPHEILLVVDALTGQDAVNAADGFNQKLGIDGIIMTKMDGDSRGGAALSAKKVTGKPIKFLGTGEKSDALEPFHPDRLASRILGMGDMLSLIERAEQAYDEEQAEKLERKIRKNQFTLEDFLEQMGQVRKMGGLAKIMDMLPGMGGGKISEADIAKGEKEFRTMEAIIRSMTVAERKNPGLLNASRRKRIAAGSGQTVNSVNKVISKYEESKKLMKQFANPNAMKKGGKLFKGLF